MARLALIAVIVLSCATGDASSQTDAGAEIFGRVFDEGSAAPIGGARVFLYPSPYPEGTSPMSTVTDQHGEYVFQGIRAGRYRVLAHHPQFYLSSATRDLTWVTLEADQQYARLDLMLSPGAMVSGRAFDPIGKPQGNVFIGALQLNGTRRLVEMIPRGSVARTDGSGRFQISGLPPGSYLFVANQTRDAVGGATAGINPDSLSYYPGTPDISLAQEVAISSPGTIERIVFTIRPAPGYVVSGIVFEDTGGPVHGAAVSIDAAWPIFGGPKGISSDKLRGTICDSSSCVWRLQVEGHGSRNCRNAFNPGHTVHPDQNWCWRRDWSGPAGEDSLTAATHTSTRPSDRRGRRDERHESTRSSHYGSNKARRLLTPQRDHRIDTGGPTRWHVSGDDTADQYDRACSHPAGRVR
jgi:hypothetical protein